MKPIRLKYLCLPKQKIWPFIRAIECGGLDRAFRLACGVFDQRFEKDHVHRIDYVYISAFVEMNDVEY